MPVRLIQNCYRVIWLVLSSATLFSQSSFAENPEDGPSKPSLERMLEAWGKRSSLVRSLSVKWTETHLDYKGCISRESVNPDDWAPAEDSEYTGEYELKLSGDLSIYKYDGPRMRLRKPPEKSTYTPFKSLEAFDGHEGRSLRMTLANDEIPIGVIQREDGNPDSRNAGHAPLAWFSRPANLQMGGFAVDKLDLMATQMDYRGTECMLLLDDSFSPHTQVWVAPSLDYNVLGVTVKAGNSNDTTTWEIWATYDRNAEGAVIPTSWVFDASTSSGEKQWHISSRIHEFSLNVPIDESEFKIAFPAKTLVHDLKQDTRYLVEPDGSSQAVSPAAVGLTYKELRSASVDITTSPKSSYSYLLVALNLLAIAIIGCWVLCARKAGAKSN